MDLEEERAMIEEWMAETHFDEEMTGVPPLEPEEDDED